MDATAIDNEATTARLLATVRGVANELRPQARLAVSLGLDHSTFCERSWLPTPAITYIDALLDRVDDPARRMLVCRLAAAAITAGGYLSVDDRMR